MSVHRRPTSGRSSFYYRMHSCLATASYVWKPLTTAAVGKHAASHPSIALCKPHHRRALTCEMNKNAGPTSPLAVLQLHQGLHNRRGYVAETTEHQLHSIVKYNHRVKKGTTAVHVLGVKLLGISVGCFCGPTRNKHYRARDVWYSSDWCSSTWYRTCYSIPGIRLLA